MAGFSGNETDGFEFLMADKAKRDNEQADLNTAQPKVKTQIDEPAMVSEPVVVAPQLVAEAPILRPIVAPKPQVDYEHKFKTIEGMLKARNGEVDGIIATMQAKLDAETTARVDAEQKLAEVPLDYAEIMGDEAYDDLGESAVDGINKMLDAKLSVKDSEIGNLKSIINNLQDGFAQKSADEEVSKAKDEANEHDRRVMQEVPEFLAYIKDDGFISFLDAEKDRLTGQSLRTTFDNADSIFDSIVVVNICKLYKASLEAREAGAYRKEEHVAPSVNSQSPVTVDKPMMKWADYNRMADGLLNQTISETEFFAFNNAFELAKSEGRVQ